MAEWSNAAVLKTVVPIPRDRGFESLFLRTGRQRADEISPFVFLTGGEQCHALANRQAITQ